MIRYSSIRSLFLVHQTHSYLTIGGGAFNNVFRKMNEQLKINIKATAENHPGPME